MPLLNHSSLSKNVPLIHALSWIVLSLFVITGTSYKLLTYYLDEGRQKKDPRLFIISSLIQTGPQKEALRSEYLAELMGLSVDHPVHYKQFSSKMAEKKLLSSPLIQEAHVKQLKPTTIYVDYTVRQPVGWLYDYENVALDKDGYLIPVHPFFPPKNLPEIYIGMQPFGQLPQGDYLPVGRWKQPLKGQAVELAFDLLSRLQPLARDLFILKRVDVSHAFEGSYGKKEIVVVIENQISWKVGAKGGIVLFTHYLRLSTKNYAQELGNYVELRKKILDEDFKKVQLAEGSPTLVNGCDKVIDLRLAQLAFIEDVK